VTQKERITAFVGYNNVLIRHYYYWRIVTFLIIAYLLTYLFIKAAFEAVYLSRLLSKQFSVLADATQVGTEFYVLTTLLMK